MLRQESDVSTLLQTCRRVPQPQPLTPRSEGVQFRKYLEENRRRELEKLAEEEQIWRRRERYDRAADPTWRARLLEQSQRTSQLYRAAVLSARQKEPDQIAHELSSRPLSSSTSNPAGDLPSEHSAASIRPSSTLTHNTQPNANVVVMHKKRGKRAGRKGSVASQPSCNKAASYATPITTMFLEKQKAEKPYAIAHAQRDLLSIGVIETKVKELFVGSTAMTNVIALCEEAAKVSEATTSIVAGQQYDGDDESKKTSLEGMTVLPYGREVQRVASAMHSESQRRSFVAFDRLQAAKRAARHQLESFMNDEFSQLFREVETIVHR